MAEVEIRIEGLAQFGRRLDTARHASTRELDVLVDRTARLIRDETRRRVPRGATGAARASLRIVEGEGTAQLVGGGRRAVYFGWLDFGGVAGRAGPRRPYLRRGRYLIPTLLRERASIQAATEHALGKVVLNAGLDG